MAENLGLFFFLMVQIIQIHTRRVGSYLQNQINASIVYCFLTIRPSSANHTKLSIVTNCSVRHDFSTLCIQYISICQSHIFLQAFRL